MFMNDERKYNTLLLKTWYKQQQQSHETNGKANWGRGLALPRDLVFNKTIVVSYHLK